MSDCLEMTEPLRDITIRSAEWIIDSLRNMVEKERLERYHAERALEKVKRDLEKCNKNSSSAPKRWMVTAVDGEPSHNGTYWHVATPRHVPRQLDFIGGIWIDAKLGAAGVVGVGISAEPPFCWMAIEDLPPIPER